MIFQSTIEQFTLSPKRLFLIDGFGAILSALLLGIVLVQLESIFGIPPNTLYILATLPCFFAIYDLYCYFIVKTNISIFLKTIALINTFYCILSLGFAYTHHESITTLGWLYIIGEVLIVLYIALLEFKVANNIESKMA